MLGAHCLGLWFLLDPNAEALPPPPDTAMMMVELGAAASVAVKDVELTPGTKQVRSRPEVAQPQVQPSKSKVRERVVAKTEMALPKPMPKVQRAPVPKATEAVIPEDAPQNKAAEATTAPATSAAPPQDHTAAPVPGLSRVSQVVGRTDWRDALLSHVQRHTRYPRVLQGRRAEGVVYVRIAMNCQGQLLEKSLYRKSGYGELDREALATLERAQPLPAPSEAPNDMVELVVPIHFFLR